MIAERAPAKINLFLHVGPVRADGLHAIESLFVFAEDGDVLEAKESSELSLRVTGRFASALEGAPVESNLVWRAASRLRELAGAPGAAMVLDKRLPVASGVGGGSADAAASLRALTKLWRLDIDAAALRRLAFDLGADVPACLAGSPSYVRGAGEIVREGPRLPPLWICLINPGVPMPTGPVFRAFDRAHPHPEAATASAAGPIAAYDDLKAFLLTTRNDLEPFALDLEPSIGVVRNFLAECAGCLLARMSGSGATVFGLFTSPAAAERAARLASARGWWSMATKLAGAAAAGKCESQ